MNKPWKYIIFLFIPCLIFQNTNAQLGGNNLLEYQIGNLPYDTVKNYSALYNQLNLNYRYKGLYLFAKTEQSFNVFEDRNYIRLSQFRAKYSQKGFKLEAGHFFDQIGNGILLRGYEIPGSVFEDQIYRVKKGFYRDILGVNLSYRHKYFEIKGIRGRPLLDQIPPTFSEKDRRPDLIEAGEVKIKLLKQKWGLAYLRNSTPTIVNSYFSVLLDGNLPFGISYKSEWSHKTGEVTFNDNDAYAGYLSLSYSGKKLGVSLEGKQYHNYFLGSGFTDPPTTVKEHSWRTLNRSTHVPQLFDEAGIQAELFYNFGEQTILTLNYTLNRNEFAKAFVFKEYYAELFFTLLDNADVKVFADYANDPFKLEPHRMTGGFLAESGFRNSMSASIQAEYQYIKRNVITSTSFSNFVIIPGFSPDHKLSISVIWEMSGDPYLTDNPNTTLIEKRDRHWIGGNLSYKLTPKNTFNLFAGTRRGGPACTSGICYEVLDFKGIELRINTRF